jgi:hypothetical protein
MSLIHLLSLIQETKLMIIFLPHFRTLVHFDSSTIILKVRVLELEKMISIYQTNMGELERIKLELSKCKSENVILNVQI